MMASIRAQAVTLDFFGTLVFHRDGRGRGRRLVEYLQRHGLRPATWQHEILDDVFAPHDQMYSPLSPPSERQAYFVDLAARVFERLGVRAPHPVAVEHAEALWQILGPPSFAVFPDAIEALRTLRGRRIPLAVVSNWHSGLRHFCTELELGHSFEHVCSSADVGSQKPDRRIFLEACQRLQTPPECTLHVGDSYPDDYVGGASAGLQVALLDRIGGSGQETARTIRSLAEVVDLVTDATRPGL